MSYQHIQHILTQILNQINNQSNSSDIHLTTLPSLSNDVYKVQITNSKTANKIYLLKIFREYLKQFTNKSVENDVVTRLAKLNLYPTIHVANEKLRLQDFIEGSLMDYKNIPKQQLLQLMKILGSIVKTLKTYSQHQPSTYKHQRQISQMYITFHSINKQCSQQFPQSYKLCKQYILSLLDQKIKQHLLAIVPKQMLPTHNDCYPPNILISNLGKLYLLDYEFFCPNYRGYELGNFFCQLASDPTDNYKMKDQLQLDQNTQDLLIQHYYKEIEVPISLLQAKQQVKIGKLLSRLFWFFVGVIQIQDKKMEINMQCYIKNRYQQFMKIYNQL